MKKLILLTFTTLFLSVSFAGPLWHCTANNQKGAVWNQYGTTERATRFTVEKECIPNNKHHECPIVCFPPRIYWRCIAHDTLPAFKPSKNVTPPKRGTWYWTSSAKTVAMNGARDACRHNSAFGGCYTNPKNCQSS